MDWVLYFDWAKTHAKSKFFNPSEVRPWEKLSIGLILPENYLVTKPEFHSVKRAGWYGSLGCNFFLTNGVGLEGAVKGDHCNYFDLDTGNYSRYPREIAFGKRLANKLFMTGRLEANQI